MKASFQNSIFWKLFVSLLLTVAVIFACVITVYTHTLYETVATSKYENLSEALTGALRYVNIYLENAYSTMRLAARDEALYKGTPQEIRQTLESYAKNNTQFDNLYLQYADGSVICGEQHIYDAMRYQLPKVDLPGKTVDIVMTDAYYSRMVQATTVALAVRVADANGTSALLIGELMPSNLRECVKDVLGKKISFAIYSVSNELISYETSSLAPMYGGGGSSIRPNDELFQTIQDFIESPGYADSGENQGIIMLTGVVKKPGWKIVMLVDAAAYRIQLRESINGIVWGAYLFFLLIVLVSYLVSRVYTRPILCLSSSVDEITHIHGAQMPRELMNRKDNIGTLARSIQAMLDRTDLLVEGERKAQEERNRLEIILLQNQISPHFFSNALSCAVACLLQKEYKTALDVLQQMIRILNYGIDQRNDRVTLREEIAFLKAYCEVFRVRKGKNFALVIDIPEEMLSITVAKMLLQPLVENALFHGFVNNREDYQIRISAEHRDNTVAIRIWNNGKAMPLEEIKRLNEELKSGTVSEKKRGVGLKNSAARIKLLYGDAYGIELDAACVDGFAVVVTIPWM